MDKRRLKGILWGFICLAVLVLALMLGGNLRRTAHITLPSSDPPRDPSAEDGGSTSSALTVIEITPETVQAAIDSLSRPENYGRSVTVEQFWTGGSGTQTFTVAVRGPWTRVDRALPGGDTRTSITNGKETYVWYNEGSEIYHGAAGGISADTEQSIPTYEDILELPAENLLQADYRALDALRCIYTETAADPAGYVTRYWVSVDTGLLVQAERLLGENIVYRMSALSAEEVEYDASLFALPDGVSLLEPNENN